MFYPPTNKKTKTKTHKTVEKNPKQNKTETLHKINQIKK